LEEADFKIRRVRTLLTAAGAGSDCEYDCPNYGDGCRCCHTVFSKILLLSSCALLGCAWNSAAFPSSTIGQSHTSSIIALNLWK
jgi:hypothetical protein